MNRVSEAMTASKKLIAVEDSLADCLATNFTFSTSPSIFVDISHPSMRLFGRGAFLRFRFALSLIHERNKP